MKLSDLNGPVEHIQRKINQRIHALPNEIKRLENKINTPRFFDRLFHARHEKKLTGKKLKLTVYQSFIEPTNLSEAILDKHLWPNYVISRQPFIDLFKCLALDNNFLYLIPTLRSQISPDSLIFFVNRATELKQHIELICTKFENLLKTASSKTISQLNAELANILKSLTWEINAINDCLEHMGLENQLSPPHQKNS